MSKKRRAKLEKIKQNDSLNDQEKEILLNQIE